MDENTSDGAYGNNVKKHTFYIKIFRSRTATRNNRIKTAGKLKNCKKTKSLAGNKDTTNCGFHHGLSVVSSGSTIFCSFLLPQAWQLGDVRGESKYTHLGLEQGIEVPEPAKHRKEPYRSVKWEKIINYKMKHIILPKNGTK